MIHAGLASMYTSYVAVDTKENKELKDSWMTVKTRDIPIDVAHGWGGGMLGGFTGYGAPMAMACSANLGLAPRSLGSTLMGRSTPKAMGAMFVADAVCRDGPV